MKIWLLTTEYPPYFGGGIATYSATTVSTWIMHHHTVTVIVRDPNLTQPIHIHEDNGVRVVRFSDDYPAPNREALDGAALISFLFASVVARLIAEDGPPDIIESQDYLGIAYFILQRKYTLDPLFQSIPVVITVHGPKFVVDEYEEVPLFELPDYWTRVMEKFSLMAADQVIAPSQYVLNQVQSALPNLNGMVIPNPYPLPPVESLTIPQPSRNLLYLGRVQRLKGIVPLLSALEILWDQGDSLTLDVVGGDSHFYPKNISLQTLLTQQHRDAVQSGHLRFHGLQSPGAVSQRLQNAGLVVVPSYFENLPYAVLEPMAWQRVVLASSSGGHREIIQHGKNGFIFAHGESERLAEQIRHILTKPADEWAAIGTEARKTIGHYCDPNRIATLKDQLFTSIQKSSRRSTWFPFLHVGSPATARTIPPHTPEEPLLSVVVPYHNLGDYIEDAVSSALESTLLPDEIIIVNDGSTDVHSIAMLYRLEERHPQVRVIRQRQTGLATARNIGASQAKGRFLGFLDADDMVSPTYFARAISILEQYHNVGMVGAWTQYFGSSQNLWPTWNTELPYILYHNTLNSSALVIRRAWFLECGRNNPDMAYGMEDWDAVIQMVGHGFGGVAIPEPLFKYRVRPDSMSRGFNRSNVELLYQLMSRNHTDLFRLHAVDLANLLNANGPQYRADTPIRPTTV